MTMKYGSMNISFTGAFGTGKTSSINQLALHLNHQCQIVEDEVRTLCRSLHYNSIEALLMPESEDYFLSSLNMTLGYLLCTFDKIVNNHHQLILVDHDPIAYYAYYCNRLAEYQTRFKKPAREVPMIDKLVNYYSPWFGINFYFPINTIPLVADDIRVKDYEFQRSIDALIQEGFKKFKPKNLIPIQSESLEDRNQEICYWIEKLLPSIS